MRTLRASVAGSLVFLALVCRGADTNTTSNISTNKGPTAPDDTELQSFKHMSLEQLMTQDVTSVAREAQPWVDAPAAIQVVTSDDIHLSGASSIPEALRLADNLEVAQANAHDWAISARGFNSIFSDKLLVLMDGRTIYTPLYGGVIWQVQDYLMEDIDRIEVISGPGGTLWGANAVNGVINITTKSARDTQGVYIESGGGNELQAFAGVREGFELGSNIYARVYGKYDDRGEEFLTNHAGAHDAWSSGQGGLRIDGYPTAQNNWTLESDYYRGGENYGTNNENENFSGEHVLGRWTHSFSEDSSMSLQTYYDRTFLSVPYQAVPATPIEFGFPAGFLTDSLDTFDIDFQHSFSLWNRNNIVWGLGYRFTRESDETQSDIRFEPPILNQNLFSGFLQDEIKLFEPLSLTIGSKVEHNDYTGFEYEPSGRLQWKITDKQTVWAAVSRAVRTPSRFDRDLQILDGFNVPLLEAIFHAHASPYILLGDPDFISETVLAYELGYRAQLGSKFALSASSYYNDYSHLRSVGTSAPGVLGLPWPYYFGNSLEGDTYGLELAGTYQLLDNWRLHAGYDVEKEDIHAIPGFVDADNGGYDTTYPQQQFSIRSSLALTRDIDFDTTLRWMDRFHMYPSPTGSSVLVPGYFELNARLAWRPVQHLELSVVGDNLLHAYHVEYASGSGVISSPIAIGRSVYGKASFTW